MKKLAVGVFAAVALFATSCKKDKDGKDLVGSWKETMSREVTYVNDKLESDDTTKDAGTIYEFKDDYKTLNISSGGFSLTANYSVKGNQLTMSLAGVQSVGTYKVSGNNLELQSEDISNDNGNTVKVVSYTYATKQ